MSPFAIAKASNPFLSKTQFRTAVRKIRYGYDDAEMSTREAGDRAVKENWL